MRAVRHGCPTASPRPAATTRGGEDERQEPAIGQILRLQRSLGNRAVGTLLRQPVAVQRSVGWPEAKGWNAGAPRTIDAQHKMHRVALAGLPGGKRPPSLDPAKTDETAGDDTGARAIVWIHPAIDAEKPVQVLSHLHGLTNRSADPFAGWRENNADPKTEESDLAKADALKTATEAWKRTKKEDRPAKPPRREDMPNPLANK